MDRFVPAEPIHPGEYIRDELEARGWAQDDLASVLDMSLRQISNLIGGRSGVTPEVAHALAQAFGQEAETWMNLQASFELARTAQESREVAKRAAAFEKVPVRALQSRGWLPEQLTDGRHLQDEVCRFLRIGNINDRPPLNIAAKKSTTYTKDNGAQIAWYARARELAECVSAAKYDEKKFPDMIKALRLLLPNRADIRRVPKTLAEFGIRLVIVEHLPKSKIDGAAFWVDDSPAIAISLRFDRVDNFWHTLIHETVHVKYRDAAVVDVDIMDTDEADMPPQEQRANAEAADILIPRAKLENFMMRTRPQYYQTKIVQFAQAQAVHPAIVVGQLQRRKELEYSQLRKLLEPIRDVLIGQGLTDGWGNCPLVGRKRQ